MPAPELTAAQVARRRRYTRLWVVAAVSWSLVRTTLVWAALSQYGVHPVVYLFVDLCSAATLSVSMPRLVISLVDRQRRRAVVWGAVTVVGYLVPDVYIFVAGDHLPWLAVAVVLAFVYVSVAVGAVGIHRRVVAVRAARGADRVEAELSAPA